MADTRPSFLALFFFSLFYKKRREAKLKPSLTVFPILSYNHRKMIYTEEKAKVDAAAWGAEFIQFLAVLAILLQDDLKNRMICTRTS